MPAPHQSPLTSFWGSLETELRNHRTTKDLPREIDVLVVGSGFTGSATSFLTLRDAITRPSLLILEAREACSGATGRNGGHIKPDPYNNVLRWVKTYGLDVAQQLVNFETRQVWEMKKLIEEEDIDCDFELTRGMDVYLSKSALTPAIRAYQDLKRSGFRFDNDMQVIFDPSRAEQVSGVKGALGLFSFSAGSVHPVKFVSHLLRRCLEWGANLQTNTKVTSISSRTDNEGYYEVATDRGSIRARKIVVATNAYTSSLLPEFQGKIRSMRGVVARIAVPDNAKRFPLLNNTFSLRFSPGEYDYLIPRSDASIIVGGAKQAALLNDDYWLDNANDSEVIPGAKEYFDGYMQRNFHGWRDTGAGVTHLWTGAMGWSEDLSPWVGESDSRKGVFIAGGFTAHGMPRILGCAEALAKLVRGDISHVSHPAARIPAPLWITPERMQSKTALAVPMMRGGVMAAKL